MKRLLMLALLALQAGAHRLDEYLQASLLSVDRDRIQGEICLTPGVAVFPAVLAGIDLDRNGAISVAEQQSYAAKVLSDLRLTVDGQPLRLQLLSVTFASLDDMKEGRGEIGIQFSAQVPNGGPSRKLVFENHHQERISAYLVNALVPRDRAISLAAQNRNHSQTIYTLDYRDNSAATPWHISWWTGPGWLLGAALLLIAARVAWLAFGKVIFSARDACPTPHRLPARATSESSATLLPQ